MKIMVRAPNPGGRGRVVTILKNRGLLVDGTDPITGPYTNRPVPGLRIDEIGPIQISATVTDTAYHANLWIVEPLLSAVKRAIVDGEDEHEANTLMDAIKTGATLTLYKQFQNGLKSPQGYTTATNVTFILPRWINTPRREWA
jgi:hypothetical protein